MFLYRVYQFNLSLFEALNPNHHLLPLIFIFIFRYATAKNYDAAITLTKDSALALLEKGEGNLAAEVGEQLISTLEKGKLPLTAELENTIATIFRSFKENSALIREKMISASIGTSSTSSPSVASTTEMKLEDPAVRFMNAALTWSATAQKLTDQDVSSSTKESKPRQIPSPVLSRLFAHYLASKGAFAQANLHYLRSDAPAAHAAMLLQWAAKGDPSEVDIFIARAVLQTMAKSEGSSVVVAQRASELLRVYSLKHQFDGRFQANPLIHFCKLLIQAASWGKTDLFSMLQVKYEFVLSRDETFSKLLTAVGARCFNISAPKGFLDSLLS